METVLRLGTVIREKRGLHMVGTDSGAAKSCADRPDYDLASAVPGSFAIEPVPGMVDALARDYANTTAMIFGAAPSFDETWRRRSRWRRA